MSSGQPLVPSQVNKELRGVENWPNGQGHPFSISVEINGRCIFGANLVRFD